MASTTTEAMVKMVETLPPELHERVLEHMREFIEDILEDAKWSESFAKSQDRLAAAASQAKKGKSGTYHHLCEQTQTPRRLRARF